MRILTPAEVARRAKPPVSPDAVREWADLGKLPCMRTETGVRVFLEADVEKFLAERQRRALAAAR
jgi:predicted site-specific integrase-resolvase